MTVDPTVIYGPYAAMALLVYAVVHLYRENTALRKEALDLLKKYQERDEEDRKWRVEQQRRREEREGAEERAERRTAR